MSDTNIGWSDRVWNPVTGCSKVSEVSVSLRRIEGVRPRSEGVEAMPNAAENVVLHPDRLDAPLKWKTPSRCFVNSMSDLFHEQVPDEFIDRVWGVMVATPQHTYQILTKRPQRMSEYLSALTCDGGYRPYIRRPGWKAKDSRDGDKVLLLGEDQTWPLLNVWLGTSVEDQRAADERIPHLLNTPAAVRFLSCEPLLGPIEFSDVTKRSDAVQQLGRKAMSGIDWVIGGGESGPGHRQMDLGWLTSIVGQCQVAGIATFIKQDSGQYPGKQGRIPDDIWALKQFPGALAASAPPPTADAGAEDGA